VRPSVQEFVLDDCFKKLTQGTGTHTLIRREIGIRGMSDLVEIVADALELVDERDWQAGRIGRGMNLDLAVGNELRAQTRHREAGGPGLGGQGGMQLVGYTDQNLAGAGSRFVCTRPRQAMPHLRLGSGRRKRPDRRGPGEWRSTLPGEWDLDIDIRVSGDIDIKSTSRYPTAAAYLGVDSCVKKGRKSYSQKYFRFSIRNCYGTAQNIAEHNAALLNFPARLLAHYFYVRNGRAE